MPRKPHFNMIREFHLADWITLGNAFCGLLAIAKAIDALALAGSPVLFYARIEQACMLIFVAMILDALDGFVARLTKSSSEIGAQLDSFSDMLTFGVAPGLLVKMLVEHEGPLYGYHVNPRLHFVAAAVFAVMAILRLARFNLENEPDESAHTSFKGLPSPAAAGAVAATMLMYLSLKNPAIETSDGTRTPLGAWLRLFPQVEQSPFLAWFLPALALMLPALGLLMVSRVRYVHMFSALTGRGQFVTLVSLVFAAFCLFVAPVLAMFLVFNGYVLMGVARAVLRRGGPREQHSPV